MRVNNSNFGIYGSRTGLFGAYRRGHLEKSKKKPNAKSLNKLQQNRPKWSHKHFSSFQKNFGQNETF